METFGNSCDSMLALTSVEVRDSEGRFAADLRNVRESREEEDGDGVNHAAYLGGHGEGFGRGRNLEG